MRSMRTTITQRAKGLIDDWLIIAKDRTSLQYASEIGSAPPLLRTRETANDAEVINSHGNVGGDLYGEMVRCRRLGRDSRDGKEEGVGVVHFGSDHGDFDFRLLRSQL